MNGHKLGKIVFATGNSNKLKELINIMGESIPFELVNQDLDVPEIQGSIHQVAMAKCIAAAAIIKGPVFIEDTSLCFDAFKGLPGPYIKYFLDSLGAEGLYKLLNAFPDKSGQAVCTIAYTEGEGQEVHIFQGIVEGTIVPPRGKVDFGWDPCFLPKNSLKTFGEMTDNEKDEVSHRYKAVIAFKNHLMKKINSNNDS